MKKKVKTTTGVLLFSLAVFVSVGAITASLFGLVSIPIIHKSHHNSVVHKKELHKKISKTQHTKHKKAKIKVNKRTPTKNNVSVTPSHKLSKRPGNNRHNIIKKHSKKKTSHNIKTKTKSPNSNSQQSSNTTTTNNTSKQPKVNVNVPNIGDVTITIPCVKNVIEC